MKIKDIYKNKELRLYINTTISFVITILFALYNGILGIVNSSIWNGSICVYFILLTIMKIIILTTERRIKTASHQVKIKTRYKIFITISILLLVLNLALITPISLMVMNKKEVNFGMITAITLASYTTYKITYSIIMYVKNKTNRNLIFRQLRLINLIDAIISVLTLQNTLIVVNGPVGEDMFILSAITSAVAVGFILIIVCVSLIKGIRNFKEDYNTDIII